MRMRRPGNAELGIVYLHSSSLGLSRTNLYFHFAFRFKYLPMTRAHARLLGPCFKTGPESTQSNSVADRLNYQGLFENTMANSCRISGPAPGPITDLSQHACHRPNAINRGPAPSVYCRASRPGYHRFEDDNKLTPTDSTANRRPTPNRSRRPTRGEVHTFITD